MVQIFLFFVAIIFLLYAVMILYYRASWLRLNEHKLNKNYNPKTKVSILIPARNEALHLPVLLNDLVSQYYPQHLMEIIVIDDHSTDHTSDIVATFKQVKYISLAEHTQGKLLNAYKKKAIEIGIRQSSGELIITTDADCTLCNYWLLGIINFYETYHHQLIAAPVIFSTNSSWFQLFQSIDFMTMQGITGALAYTKSGTMCNGANLAYTRAAFDAVQGFQGIDDIASGDDMLLMYKIEKQFPKRTAYLKCVDSIVYTQPMHTFKQFLQQRIRWASKANKFEDKRIKTVLAIVYIFNLMFPILLVLSFFKPALFISFITLWFCKTGVELLLLLPVAKFFHKQKELWLFPLLQFLHIPYILYSGLRGQTGSYEWKERRVK